jgi:hypothetical protein
MIAPKELATASEQSILPGIHLSMAAADAGEFGATGFTYCHRSQSALSDGSGCTGRSSLSVLVLRPSQTMRGCHMRKLQASRKRDSG